jgi:hypothetical protein
MSVHMFDSAIADEVGVNAAVIYQNIAFWCERNEANNENMHEGRAWTFNSVKAYGSLFPYLTPDQIRRSLEKLVEVGLLGSGHFHEDQRIRAKWFCVLRQSHLALMPAPFGTDAKCTNDTDVNTDINTDGKPNACAGLFDAMETPDTTKKADRFEEFWKSYPKKAGKPAAKRNFDKAVKGGADPDAIITGAKRYALWLSSGGPKDFRPEAKFPQGWLTDQRWNDADLPELPYEKPKFEVGSPEDLAERRKRLGPRFGEGVR